MYNVLKEPFFGKRPAADVLAFVNSLMAGDAFICPLKDKKKIERALDYIRRPYKSAEIRGRNEAKFWIIAYYPVEDLKVDKVLAKIKCSTTAGLSRRHIMRFTGFSGMKFQALHDCLVNDHGVVCKIKRDNSKDVVWYFPKTYLDTNQTA